MKAVFQYVNLLMLAMLISISLTLKLNATELDCSETKIGSAVYYWSRDGDRRLRDKIFNMKGIVHSMKRLIITYKDENGNRIWSLGNKTCYVTPLSDIKNKSNRVRGYKKELINTMHSAYITWISLGKQHFKKYNQAFFQPLLENNFESYPFFEKWWFDNRSYLYWSEQKQTLVVNQNAKADKRPINVLDVERKCATIMPISGIAFWYANQISDFQLSFDTKTHRYAYNHFGEYKTCFKAPLTEVNDIRLRTIGYKSKIDFLLWQIENEGQTAPYLNPNKMRITSINMMTNQRFYGSRSLKSWWKENSDYMKYSPYDAYLIVDKRAKNAGTPINTILPHEEIMISEAECLYTNYENGVDYMKTKLKEGIDNIMDSNGKRIWKKAGTRGKCKRTPLVEIYDKEQRITGRFRALTNWFDDYMGKSSRKGNIKAPKDEIDMEQLSENISLLTGIEFIDPQEAEQWWIENNHFLTWSMQQQQFVIDETAKAQKKSIIHMFPYSVKVEPPEYWYLYAIGNLELLDEDSSRTLSRNSDGLHVQISIQNRHILNYKELGYNRALDELIIFLQEPVDSYEQSEKSQKTFDSLKRITDRSFNDPAQWVEWYAANNGKLTLSEDGERLVAGE